VKLFADSLRDNLATSGKFRITPLDCQPSPCTAATSDPAQLIANAKQAGAAYLLVGGIHKMSTLVQWAKFDIWTLIRKMLFSTGCLHSEATTTRLGKMPRRFSNAKFCSRTFSSSRAERVVKIMLR
jgi:hypothetical protein